MRPAMIAVLAASAVVLSSWIALPAQAIVTQPFAADAFAAAQGAGKAVVIHVTASWCPTCKAQHQVLKSIEGKPELAAVTIMDVDFDTQKDALKTFRVANQSTLIAFKGKTEIGRSVGDTTPDGIEKLITSTLK